MTGFKFAFPMLTSDDLYKLSNTWTSQLENNKSYLTDNRLTDWLHSAAAMSANFIGAELSNLKNLFTGDTNKAMNKASAFEMARYFNFNTEDADEITVSFVLFNTIVKNGVVDQWKRNLYFISLFNLRNLPFKLDYTTYLPPLLYDLIIPGVKRLPFCYVSSFGAVPQGLIRNMKINNFLSAIAGNDTNANSVISVPIPEAWTITITFKSMVARTANLMLAGGADLPITINMSAKDAENADPTLKEYNEMIKKMEENTTETKDEKNKDNPVFNFIAENAAKKAAKPVTDLLYGETRKEEEKNYNLSGLTSAEGDNIKLSSDVKWNVENNQSLEDKLLGRIGTNTAKNDIIFNTRSNTPNTKR